MVASPVKLAALILFVLLTAALGAALLWPMSSPARRQVDWGAAAAGSTDAVSVYWVGHSLVNARDPKIVGARNLIEKVGDLARSQGLQYDSFDHTIYGAPLSMLWRGRPHSYDRREPQMVERLQTLLDEGARFDALVMTEGVPLESSIRYEHTSYYVQQFYCALASRRPDARIYLYECWSNLHASDVGPFYPPASVFDWTAQLAEDRERWERIADEAATGAVPAPGWVSRIGRWFGGAEPACEPHGPIFLIPVGTVFRRLAERLEREPLSFRTRAMKLADLFTNAYEDWPADWPLTEPLPAAEQERALAALTKRYPDEPLDDIHPSDLGVYVASLTHFAALYRRSPVGLPAQVEGLDEENARRVQELVWSVVRDDPRAGVRTP